MKFAFLGAAAGAALMLASAAHAADETTTLGGYLDGDYSYMSVRASGLGSANVNVYGGKAAVAFPIASNWGGQLDGTVNVFQTSNSFGIGDQTVVSPTGHAFYRNDKWLAGAFVGADIAPHLSLVGGGLEGQYYVNKDVTVDGGFGYAAIDKSGSPNIWGVRLNAKGFVTDNLSIGAGVNYANLSGSGLSADLWTEKVNGEWQLNQVPVAITLGYEHANLNKLSVSSDSVLVGLRWSFGGSLRDREHHGASLPNVTDTFGGQAGQALVGIASAAYGYIF